MKKYFKHKIENIIIIKNIITIEYLELSKSYCYNLEKHNFWEMVYVDKEGILYDIGEETIRLKEGELFFLKPNQPHSIYAGGEKAPSIFVMCFECASPIMSFFENYKVKLNSKIKSYITNIINETLQTFKLPFKDKLIVNDNPNLGGQHVIRIFLELTLIALLRQEATKENDKTAFLKNENFSQGISDIIIKYLNENIYGNLKIEDIIKKINYSKSYLSQAFKTSTGKTIIEYYNILKITEAKKIIRENPEMTFANISDMLNFSDPRYFGYLFKKITNKTPGQYKQSIMQFELSNS